MRLTDLDRLTYFDRSERRTDGLPVDWDLVDFRTIHAIDQMRARLNAPVYLIRETHPNRPGAIDGTCPTIPLSYVFMEGLMRLDGASWGVYAGNSWHVDFRAPEQGLSWPARWMAVKPSHAPLLKERGLECLIQRQKEGIEKDGWVYLIWNHPRSYEGLSLVFELSERHWKGGARDA